MSTALAANTAYRIRMSSLGDRAKQIAAPLEVIADLSGMPEGEVPRRFGIDHKTVVKMVRHSTPWECRQMQPPLRAMPDAHLRHAETGRDETASEGLVPFGNVSAPVGGAGSRPSPLPDVLMIARPRMLDHSAGNDRIESYSVEKVVLESRRTRFAGIVLLGLVTRFLAWDLPGRVWPVS